MIHSSIKIDFFDKYQPLIDSGQWRSFPYQEFIAELRKFYTWSLDFFRDQFFLRMLSFVDKFYQWPEEIDLQECANEIVVLLKLLYIDISIQFNKPKNANIYNAISNILKKFPDIDIFVKKDLAFISDFVGPQKSEGTPPSQNPFHLLPSPAVINKKTSTVGTPTITKDDAKKSSTIKTPSTKIGDHKKPSWSTLLREMVEENHVQLGELEDDGSKGEPTEEESVGVKQLVSS